MKKVAILQSSYIPWRGYFDLIASVDEFVIFDEMQYTKRDWRNRNKIKTKDGCLWLTVPVHVKGKYEQTIRETKISGFYWKIKHWKIIKANYFKAPFFYELANEIEEIYANEKFTYLSKLNRRFIELICDYLNIKTKIKDSYEFKLRNDKTDRLIGICKDLNANEYISGPSGKEYLKIDEFKNNDIKLSFADYSNYGKYKQQWNNFEDNLSILDLIFNCGKDCYKYMKFI